MKVYINKISSFLPNKVVENDKIENYIGKINGKLSRVKNIVLRQNGIKKRYYALNEQNQITHTTAQLAERAIIKLFDSKDELNSIELLSCATSTPDQFFPSQASMTHGLLKNRNMEIYSCAGVCLTSLQALKIAFLSIKSNNTQNAVCCASEMVSGCLLAKNFEEEFAKAEAVHKNPYMAFEKDFLRFMLSDGAGAVLLENKKRESGSLEIEWIEISSYAHELPTCMYLGGELDENEELVGWKSFSQSELINKSIFVIKQKY